MTSLLSSFLKIGLTVAVLECSEYWLSDISLAIMFDKWQLIILADIFTFLAEMPSGPVALFVSKDLIILLISLAVGLGNSNLLLKSKELFIL